MNKMTFSKWLVLGVAFAFATDVFGQSQAVTAKVRAIRGTAQASVNGAWKALKVNDSLKAGSVIKTEGESTVDLFINNSVIRVTPDTIIGLEKLLATDTGSDKVTETQLYLKNGRILGNVKKLAAASSYQIKTPNGVTGVRGTDFDISYVPLGNGQFKLTVTSVTGTLVTSAANSQGVILTAVVNTGETWSPGEGLGHIPPAELEQLKIQIQAVIDKISDKGGDNKPPVPNPPPVQVPPSSTTGKK